MTDNLESRLHPEHLVDLRKSGLLDETILESGIKSVRPGDIDKIIGFPTFTKSTYAIPYPGTDYSRFKIFYAEEDKINPGTGEELPKYLAKKGSGNRLYIPPQIKQILQDTTIPIYLTEGEKKSLKACQEGLSCIAIAGLWNWSDGDKNLISDFDQIALNGRTVYIVPDSHFREPDRHGKPKNLFMAVRELAYRLIDKGAKVNWVELPNGETEIKLDDYLRNHTVDEFKRLPVHQIRKLSISEEVEGTNTETPPDEIIRILKRIADEAYSRTEEDVYLKQLKERTGTTKTSMRADIRKYDGTEERRALKYGIPKWLKIPSLRA